jgi:transposase
MLIIGCDYHPAFQQIAFVDTATGDWNTARKRERKQKTDRQDAQHILHLLLKDDFPQIWVPSWENRDLRQLLWHRHRMVQARTRIMNQLQAVAINEGLRSKKMLWRESGREQLLAFRLARWASRRRQDLLKLLDGLNPTIAELTQAIEQEVEKCPAAQRLRTRPGVGALTALAFVLIIGKADRFQRGEISCLFSLALEFFTRFRGGSFQPLTQLSGKQRSGVSKKQVPRCARNDKRVEGSASDCG